MKRRIVFIISLTIIILALCGCWDRIEIEKNAFILGIGIDIGEEDTLKVTYQIALPEAMQGGGGQVEEGGGDSESSTLNIAIQGDSLKITEQILMSNIDRYPNYDHLKVIVFGEELSRQGLAEHIDFLFRNPQSRRLTKVVVCEGEAEKVFQIQPKTIKSTAQYIDYLLEDNSKHTLGIISSVDLTGLEGRFLNKTGFALSKLTTKKDTIDIQGAGLFKADQLLGWLTSDEVSAIKWISDEVDRGAFYMPLLNDNVQITTQIIHSKSKVSPILNGDHFIFNVKIQLEYDISEVSKLDYIVLDQKNIDKIEQSINNDIKLLCENTFYELRDKYNTDVYDFSDKVSNYYPKFWIANKEVWNQYFKRSDIVVDVEAKLRRIGLVK